MRKNILLFVTSLLSISAIHAQRADSLPGNAQHQYLRYMKKSSTHKAIGWALLGSGAALFGTTYLINNANGFNGPTKGENLFTAGIIAAAVSPAFFILAGVNKRKARLVLKGERLTSTVNRPLPCYPAFSLTINL